MNPNESQVLGEKCYPRLEDVPEHVDIVDIFWRSELVAPVLESAIRIGAFAVWMQEGVVDQAAGRKAKAGGPAVVIYRCILKVHQRYLR